MPVTSLTYINTQPLPQQDTINSDKRKEMSESIKKDGQVARMEPNKYVSKKDVGALPLGRR